MDYERLEFLGDAVLEAVSSEFLYSGYPDKKEGELSKIRASMVCEPSLAFCARDIRLGSFIRLGKGEERTGGRGCGFILLGKLHHRLIAGIDHILRLHEIGRAHV